MKRNLLAIIIIQSMGITMAHGFSVKKIVKKAYTKIAQNKKSGNCCNNGAPGCCSVNDATKISESIGYSKEELSKVPEANLGLGCGNPIALGEIKEGEIVLDLGSGAGIDCFLASLKVGPSGKVIGVDMTEEMIALAQENAKKHGYDNVEFKLGDIEALPVEDNSVNVVITNCVINLASDKSKVFEEAYRVLKKGGRLHISDIVLLENITEEQRNDAALIAGCVGGALLKTDYLKKITNVGFKITSLSDDTEISKRQYEGFPLESIKIVAQK